MDAVGQTCFSCLSFNSHFSFIKLDQDPIKLLDGYSLPSEFFKGMKVFDHTKNEKTAEEVEDEECDNTKENHKEESKQ